MRTFIAIELPKEIKKAVADYIDSIRSLFSHVKWVNPDNLHLTIKFLGDVNNSNFLIVRDCLEQTVTNFSPFSLGLSHIGFYPANKKARVIWIGADGGTDNLLDLYQELEGCLEHQGFDRDTRMFSPHLTIGRVKKFNKIHIPENMPDFDATIFNVNSIAIIKSTLTPKGPIYERMFKGKLINEPANHL